MPLVQIDMEQHMNHVDRQHRDVKDYDCCPLDEMNVMALGHTMNAF